MTSIRILLTEDHSLVRAGIRTLMEAQPDMEVVGEASNGEEAMEKARELRPDVVVMDLVMPGIGGMAATRRMKEEFPEVQILILTILEDDRYFFEAIRSGDSGFILKGVLPADFLSAVRTVAVGQVYLYPSLRAKLVNEYLGQAKVEQGKMAADGLTDREQQILALISEGRTGKEMARTLGISPHTVEHHRQNLMAKLDLHNRAELIQYAIRKGLLDRDG